MSVPPVYAVRGDNPELVSQAARQLVNELAVRGEQRVAPEEYGAEGLDVTDLVSSCSTPPLFADRRVVVLREVAALRQEQVGALVDYLGDPMPTTTLVLVSDGGQFPGKLLDAAKRAGEVVDASVGRDRAGWLASKLDHAPLRLDKPATQMLASHLGEDLERLPGLVDTLVASFGEGSTVGAEELEPYLGEPGSAPPWYLTDAIDRGDAASAIAALRRLTGPGERHPLVVMATLHRHFWAMLRLDGSGVTSPAEAAELLGSRSTFPAGKALSQSKRLGSEGIGRAISLLAAADLDLRGESGWPAETTLEILVARLSRLAPRTRARSRR